MTFRFADAFRDWEGGRKALVVPRSQVGRALDPLARAKAFFALVPPVYENVRDTHDEATTAAWPCLVVRPWLVTYGCPPFDQLPALWKEHGYRPLTFHEALDYAEAHLSARKRGLRHLPVEFFLAGIEAALVPSGQGEGRPVVLRFYETDAGYSLLCEDREWVYSMDGAAFLLTPLNARPDELTPPEDNWPADEPYHLAVPRAWDPTLGPDPYAEP